MSVTIEHSTTIDRPVADVWAFMDDLRNYPTWVTGLSEVRQTTAGPKDSGTHMIWVAHFLGRRLEVSTEVTEFVLYQTFGALMNAGPLKLRGMWRYAPVNQQQTRITMTLAGETGGFFKLADPLVARALERHLEASYGTLKDLLEATVPA